MRDPNIDDDDVHMSSSCDDLTYDMLYLPKLMNVTRKSDCFSHSSLASMTCN